ncbi:hypothetical protein [Tenacibaculum ovolyticum]|uniref:hypothetical protein n=1 Tax=Tenacibaculum ovolyticum TaxID=104270 RepID=UPI001F3B17AF|nr:hypothetical protein [Tenacibaculum ovolyticum]
MMIDGDMVDGKPGANYSLNDFGEYHWVTYEGGLKILNSKGESETDYDEVTDVEFNVVTWGDFKNDDPKEAKKLKLTKNNT